MRMILMVVALGISVAALARPALADAAEPDGNRTDLGTVEKILAQSDRDTPQIGVSVVAGFDQERSLVQQWRDENQEGR